MVDFADPPQPSRLQTFPTRNLAVGTKLHRIHHANLGPYWFGSHDADDDGGARFDIPAPNGSSYWALQPAASFLETIARRPLSIVPLELLDRFSLSDVELPDSLGAANTPVKRARGFGLTGEFHSSVTYAVTRRWASALFDAGHRAVIAIPRHDVTAKLRSVTLFGRAGEHVPWGWKHRTTTGPIPTSLIDHMAGWGIRCLPIPFDVETL